MPSITTHYLFAKEVKISLPKRIRKTFEEENKIYETFAQSHDFLYYNIFNFIKAPHIRDIGNKAHKNNTKEYFISIIKYILDNHLENNKQCVAYLYGSITHYVLDTTCHPFIFYKTRACNKDDKNTYKYRGLHTVMEKDLDAYYYKKYTKKEYNTCNITKEIIGNPKFNKELKDTINHTFKTVYNDENMSTYFIKGIHDARILYSLFIQDKHGIKRKMYKIIDKITKNAFGSLSSYSTYIKKPNTKFLNLEHNKWVHPCNKNISSNDSFEDLFNKSIKNAQYIIKEINNVLEHNKKIEDLDKVIKDLSYSNGLLLSEYTPMKYFEF